MTELLVHETTDGSGCRRKYVKDGDSIKCNYCRKVISGTPIRIKTRVSDLYFCDNEICARRYYCERGGKYARMMKST